MSSSSGKMSMMTLFSNTNDLYSHLVRFVLAEKEVPYDLVELENGAVTPELLDYNAYGMVPTLVDRDLVVYNAPIIVEYLDERYPHPPLMPVYPVARAEARVFVYRILQDWYTLVRRIEAAPSDEKLKKELADTLLSTVDAVKSTPFFLGEELSVLDCYVAPILWRLPELGVTLKGKGSKDWQKYMTAIFERTSFRRSLTAEELNRRAIAGGDMI